MFFKQQVPNPDKQHVSQIVSRVKREHATREYEHENQPFKGARSIMYQRSNGNVNVYVFEMGNICVRFVKRNGGVVYGPNRGHTVRTALNGYDFEVNELPDNNRDLNVIFNNRYHNIWNQLEFNGFIIKDLDSANGNSYLIDNPVTMVFGVMSIRNYSNVPLQLCAICFYKLPDPTHDQTLRIRGTNVFAHDRKVTELMEVSQFEIGRFIDQTARDIIMDMLLYKALQDGAIPDEYVDPAASGSLSVVKEITKDNIMEVNPDKLLFTIGNKHAIFDITAFLDKRFPNPFGSKEKYWNTYDRHLTAYHCAKRLGSIEIRSLTHTFEWQNVSHLKLYPVESLKLTDNLIVLIIFMNRDLIRKSKHKQVYFDMLQGLKEVSASFDYMRDLLLEELSSVSSKLMLKLKASVIREVQRCDTREKKWKKFCELVPINERRILVDWEGFDVSRMKSAIRCQLNRFCHRIAVVNHNDISSNGQWMQASRVPALKQLFRF